VPFAKSTSPDRREYAYHIPMPELRRRLGISAVQKDYESAFRLYAGGIKDTGAGRAFLNLDTATAMRPVFFREKFPHPG